MHHLAIHVRKMPRVALLALLFLSFLSAPQFAQANGRQPNTTGIAIDPGNPNRMLAGVTFGAIVSLDHGLNWRWLCEEILGGPISVDAHVAIAANGTMLVANLNGMFASTDDGCNWQKLGSFDATLQTTRMALHPTQATTWLLTLNDPNQGKGRIFQTDDAGSNFHELGDIGAKIYLYSTEFSPSTPTRLYSVGSNNASKNSCYVFRSDDAGATWTSQLVSAAPPASAQPQITIHPKDPNIVLIGAQNIIDSSTWILRSSDGAQTFSLALRIPSVIRDIVFSSDGSEAWIAGVGSLFHSTDAGATFVQTSAPIYNACVTYYAGTVYACGNVASGDPFTIGTTVDGAQTWESLMSLTDVQGPYACGTQTDDYSTCMPLWANEANYIGAPVDPVTRSPNQTSTSSQKGGCNCNSTGPLAPIWLLTGLVCWRARRRF